MSEATVKRATAGRRNGRSAKTRVAKQITVQELSDAVGESARLQAQLNQAMAKRLLEVEKIARQALAGAAARPAADSPAGVKPSKRAGAHEAVPNAQPVSIEQLSDAVGESARLQAQLNQTMAKRLLEVEKIARQAQASAAARPSAKPAAVYVGNDLALTKVLDRFLMYVDTRDLSLAPSFLMGDSWDPSLTRLFDSLLKPGMTVVDIGANFGYFTLLAATAVGPNGHVYSFEADPRNFEILYQNVAVNWMWDRVRTERCAVLDAPRKIEFYRNYKFLGCNSLFVAHPENPGFERVSIDARPLDEMVPGSVDLMKIDAEGSEPLILEGMRGVLERSPQVKIAMEFNLHTLRVAGADPEVFLQRIRQLGLAPSMVNGDGSLRPINERALLASTISTLLLAKAGAAA
jgi:FkbM family methyltransferase